MLSRDIASPQDHVFENPFKIDDLRVFDNDSLRSMLAYNHSAVTTQLLAHSMHGAPTDLVTHIHQSLSAEQQTLFQKEVQCTLKPQEITAAQQHILNDFFWELIYWKKPELYEALTEGEVLHQGIFQAIKLDLQDKTLLDAGAGSGRATFDCIRFGVSHIYAVEPSPGLLRLLRQKIAQGGEQQRVTAAAGRFDALPLRDQCVDTAISCSAFTALDDQGGEPGLAELKRVTRTGGKIIIIWPRTEDHAWFAAHGFHYVSLPIKDDMSVHFRSIKSAYACAHLFYAHNPAVESHLQRTGKPEIPFKVLGMNPPRDYFWLTNLSDT